MKTANQILLKWYTPLHRNEIADLCIEEAMKEYAVQFIDEAAKEVELTDEPTKEQIENCETISNDYGIAVGVDKQSILKLKEQLK